MPWDPDTESNPLRVVVEIGFYVSAGLRDGSLCLRSAFLLNHEAIRVRRMAYLQPAWRHDLSISGLLAIYMQRLVAVATGESAVARSATAWLVEDAPKLARRRPHYLADHILAAPGNEPTEQILLEMSRVRREYEHLSDDDGPYHTEVFPYDEMAPEEILLSHDPLRPFEVDDLEPEVERLLVSLGTGRWA